MAFHFRLERILKYRKFLLDQAQLALLAADRRRREIEEQLEALQEQIREYGERWKRAQVEGMDVATFLAYQEYLQQLKRRVPILKRELEKATAKVDKERRKVLEREKDVKMMEKLKDRYWERYQLEQRRKDQKALDEIVVLRNGREL